MGNCVWQPDKHDTNTPQGGNFILLGPQGLTVVPGSTTMVAVSSFTFSSLGDLVAYEGYKGIKTGELTGYRLWWVLPEGKLCSLVHRSIWEPGVVIEGDVDAIVGACAVPGGVYSFSEKSSLEPEFLYYRIEGATLTPASYLGETPIALVSGEISMWGEVVEHQWGYRAQYARVKSLDTLHSYTSNAPSIDELRKLYGV